MDVATRSVDALIVLLCVGCCWYLFRAYRLTRAPGLGFLMGGFLWSILVRLVIVFSVQPLRAYSAQLVLVAFVLYLIGCWRLYWALRSYYVGSGNKPWLTKVGEYLFGRGK